MKKTDTWMPLYIGDYLADTTHLTTEQHGAYLLLLMALWKRGGEGLPDVDENLAAAARLTLAKWRTARAVLLDGRLLRTDGKLVTQKRLHDELTRASRITEARANAGAKGGAIAAANRQQVDVANEQQNSTPSQSQETRTLAGSPSQDPPTSDLPDSSLFGPSPEPPATPAPPPVFTGLNAEQLNGKAVVPLAAGWELPEDWGTDAVSLGFTAKETLYQAERFRQWWTTKAGRKSVRGWRQAWGNWLGKAAERQR